MLLEPVGDFFQAALAVLGLAGTGKLVVLPVEEAEPGLYALVHQSCIHLDSLRHGTAIVLVGMDEEVPLTGEAMTEFAIWLSTRAFCASMLRF